MKKIISAAIAAALVLSMAVGCSGKKNGDTSSNPISSTVAVYDADGCTALLDGIMHYEAGTTGGSLKAVIVAVNILNWTEINQAGQDKISATVKEYLSKLSDEDKLIFKQNFEMIDEYAEDIADGNSNVTGLIADSGADKKFETYSEIKYDVFADAVEAELDKIAAPAENVSKSNFDKEDCIELMRDIADIESGSADASLKFLHAAAELVDFIIDCRKCTEDEIRDGVKAAYNELDADTQKKFDSNIGSAVEYVNKIVKDSSILSGVDENVDMDKFASDKYNTFLNAVEAETGLKLK